MREVLVASADVYDLSYYSMGEGVKCWVEDEAEGFRYEDVSLAESALRVQCQSLLPTQKP